MVHIYCGHEVGDMMASKLGVVVVEIVSQKLGEHTKDLIIHQCKELGIDYDNMQPEDLVPLAKHLQSLLSIVFGEIIAENIAKEITSLAEREFVAK